MSLDEKIEQLKHFQIYKSMILEGKTDGQNVIIEDKNGECRIVQYQIKDVRLRGVGLHIKDI